MLLVRTTLVSWLGPPIGGNAPCLSKVRLPGGPGQKPPHPENHRNRTAALRRVVGSKQTQIAQFPPHRLWHGGDAGGA
jgi:hypothetical protein